MEDGGAGVALGSELADRGVVEALVASAAGADSAGLGAACPAAAVQAAVGERNQ